MTLPYPIVASQTDAKSPVDQALMDAIRLDLDFLATQASASVYDYQWKFNGFLPSIKPKNLSRIDGTLLSRSQVFSNCRVYLEKPGEGGTLEIDVRRYTKPDALIKTLKFLLNTTVSSIGLVGSSINIQSIARASAQIATQSITQFKATLNVQGIVVLGQDNLVRYNLDVLPDSDYVVGDTVTFASCTTSANNGAFTIVRINEDGGKNIVVTNASGVAQSGIAGTAVLAAWSYNLVNPAPADFAAGEQALFASHTTGGNNGTLTIYARNSGGNNLIIKNASGATQGGATGTIDTNRWAVSFTGAAPTPDYTATEKATLASTSGASNDGKFTIVAVNRGGNNLIIYNPTGVTQGSAAGTVDTNRWEYLLPVDPSSAVAAGESVIFAGCTTVANNGTFVVKQVNRSASDNLVVYNESGATQGGAVGAVTSILALVEFTSDLSATITTASKITLTGTVGKYMDGDFQVLEVNRGGGANYNAKVTASANAVEQDSPCGRVVLEGKSIFTTKPSIVIPPHSSNFVATHSLVSSNAVIDATLGSVPAGTLVMFEFTQIPSGDAKNVTVQLT